MPKGLWSRPPRLSSSEEYPSAAVVDIVDQNSLRPQENQAVDAGGSDGRAEKHFFLYNIGSRIGGPTTGAGELPANRPNAW